MNTYIDHSIGNQKTMGGAKQDDRSMGNMPTMGGTGRLTGKRFQVGDVILCRYRVLSELGQGGMGVVYRCLDDVSGIKVALKAFPPEVARNSGEMDAVRENFKLVEKLHHPNIANVKTLEYDAVTGECFLIMEYIDGYDLRQWARNRRNDERPLTLDEIIILAHYIASALDYAHEQKVIHRDIKPSNVRVNFEGEVKVLDFGLAAQLYTSMSRVSQISFGTSGTGPYMAPEQWQGRRQTASTDQYSLAVTVYELLSGSLPFDNHDPVILQVAVLNAAVEPIEGISSEINAVLRRALSKKANERFGSCGDFVKALSVAILGSDTDVEFKRNTIEIANKAVIALFESGEYEQAFEASKKADREDPLVQFYLGQMYEYGRGVPEDAREAIYWYRKPAENGNAKAQSSLGAYYAIGDGVEKNDSEAIKWLRLAADQGDADAQSNLGLMYRSGKGVTRSEAEAVKWLNMATEQYRKSAELGDKDAQFHLGLVYAQGRGVEQDQAEAIKWYRKASEKGHAKAQLHLGYMYVEGQAVKRNMVEAIKWLRKAADQNETQAQFLLGSMYTDGVDMEKNYCEAVKWLRKASEKGDADAQYNLALMYANGAGVTQSDQETARWFRRAAENGNADAQNSLGLMYLEGAGIEKNHGEAVRWLRKAAEKGNVNAQSSLGWLYTGGIGVAQNYTEAFKWLHEAAIQEKADAQYLIGVLFENGRGVQKNEGEAIKWYHKAAKQGNTEALERIKILSKKSCFISTATASVLGWDDDGPELNCLREFRDTWMQSTEVRKAEVQKYYRIAPGIVQCINAGTEAASVYRSLCDTFIVPALSALNANDPVTAHRLYRDMVRVLERRYLYVAEQALIDSLNN